jgi:hypothetical protein
LKDHLVLVQINSEYGMAIALYNPAMYQKLADIFRVFYNYCQPSKKYKVTPAMRLGLAKGPVDIEKIIYFEKYKK